MYLCSIPEFINSNFSIAFRRAPSYLVGFIIAKVIRQNDKVDIKIILLILLCFAFMQMFFHYCYSRWIIIFPLLIFFVLFLENVKFFLPLLSFIGIISLESYLANIFLGDILNHKLWIICGVDLSYGHYLEYLSVLTFGTLIAFLVHKLSQRLL